MDLGEELRTAQRALEANDLGHAAHHLAGAMATSPRDPRVIAALEQFDRAAGPSALGYVPMSEGVFHGTAMVRAWLLARRGQLSDAAAIAIESVRAAQDSDYLAWIEEWFTRDEAVESLDPQMLVPACAGLSRSPAPPVLRSRMAKLLRRLSDAHPSAEMLTFFASIETRESGSVDEAIAFGRRRAATHPSFYVFITLASALRRKGLDDEALEAYAEAVRFARTTGDAVAALLDHGDLLLEIRRYDEALRSYDEALRRETDNSWARASAAYLRARNGDAAARDVLIAMATEQRDRRALALVSEIAPFEFDLPPRPDALISLAPKLNELTDLTVTSLEAPSAIRCLRLLRAEMKPIHVSEIPQPDPRDPIRSVPFVLWRFPHPGVFGSVSGPRAIEPVPAVDPPNHEIAEAIATIAEGDYERDAWWAAAKTVVERFGVSTARESALASMVHWPASPPDSWPLWDWAFRVQVAAAFVIARLDDTWPEGPRRTTLTALVHGPVDWTGTASLVALTEIALREPRTRDDVAEILAERAFDEDGNPVRYMCWIEPAAHLLARIPNRSPELDARLRELLALLREHT